MFSIKIKPPPRKSRDGGVIRYCWQFQSSDSAMDVSNLITRYVPACSMYAALIVLASLSRSHIGCRSRFKCEIFTIGIKPVL